jgi:hypothetical protein
LTTSLHDFRTPPTDLEQNGILSYKDRSRRWIHQCQPVSWHD